MDTVYVQTNPVNDLFAAAMHYTSLSWAVFPVHGLMGGRCTCGNPDCSRPGKHPATRNGYRDATKEPSRVREWWAENPCYNVGLPTGVMNGFWVLDVEADGLEELSALQQKHGILPSTLVARTGGGGMHMYFHWTDSVYVTNRQRLGDLRIDCRGQGGYVIAPPSMHVSGQPYAWDSLSPIIPGPQWLLNFVSQLSTGSVSNPPRVAELPRDILNRALAYLAAMPSAVSGQGGHKTTIKTALKIVRGFNIPPGNAFSLLQTWNQRCLPPWSDHELWHKVCEADRDDLGWGARGYLLQESGFTLTDLGNAERLVRRYGSELRYCYSRKAWFRWDGRRFAPDQIGTPEQFAKQTVRAMREGAAATPDETQRQALVAHARRSESRERIRAMIELARSEPGIPVTPDLLDRDPMGLNVLNGILDLRTGRLGEHWPGGLFTKLCPVEYHPDATCPLWESFVWKVFGGNTELVRFVQRLLGYCLTGDVREHVLPIFYGAGSNGKTTLLETFKAVLGDDYSMEAPQDLLMMKRNDTHPTAIADLFGKRLVAVVETSQGHRLNESLVKQLTGGDRIRARRMREDYFEFSPSHKVILCTNHRPEVRDTDHAIWRRIRLVPFTQQFWDIDKGEYGHPDFQADKTLLKRLRDELPGILAWAVQGCLEWQRNGLQQPPSVTDATANYRSDQDVLSQFLAESCILDPYASVPATPLFGAYREWCERNGESWGTQRRFGQSLSERGFQRYISNGTWYRGLSLRPPTPSPALSGPPVAVQ